MTREEALEKVIGKWKTDKPHVYGDCVAVIADYAKARTGKTYEFDLDEELTVKSVAKRLGKPVKNGEVCLFKGGMAIVLPYGGLCGSFENNGGFGFTPFVPPDLDAVCFMEAK